MKNLEILNTFGVVVGEKIDGWNLDMYEYGIVLDFKPSTAQKIVLQNRYEPLVERTLFTPQERATLSDEDIMAHQILHYIEVYGLNMPGLFNLEVDNGTVVSLHYISAVTVAELEQMVQKVLYTNAPTKFASEIREIVAAYNIDFDFNKIENNELKIALYNPSVHQFNDGDEAVRYLCYLATDDAMLIKSPETVAAVKASRNKIPDGFFEKHEDVLAQVFNRHKRLILAAKGPSTKTTVNRITRKSKTAHVPIHENIAKTFIDKALNGKVDASVLDKVSVRDKMKYLNVLAIKRLRLDYETFIIRNGKLYTQETRKQFADMQIAKVEDMVLDSLATDFAHLRNKKIRLDPNVHYALPASRKQTLGNLPYGTRVKTGGEKISSGMYWEDAWGARDLDLSIIDRNGERTGWGHYTQSAVTYSGDVTSAANGAMEFMTSVGQTYGLFVNIFSGETGCKMEIVVGDHDSAKKWIGKPLIREKITLDSRQSCIGFVDDKDYIVYSGRMSSSRVSSGGKNPLVERALANYWTVNSLFDRLGIAYDDSGTDLPNEGYDHDLSYPAFTYEKLEQLCSS